MIVLSFNARGLGGRIKKNKVKDLIRDHKVDFIAIQETKMENISDSFCRNIWGNDDCNWVFLPSKGEGFYPFGENLCLWLTILSWGRVLLVFLWSGGCLGVVVL